jgi:dihydrolipoamide dehydrogenase
MVKGKALPHERSYDLVVIGGGPAGYTAAIRAAQLGMKPALVEAAKELGGVCLNWGCIPTKSLLRQAELYRLFQRAEEFGLSAGEVSFDWKKVVARSRRTAAQLGDGVDYLMKKNGVALFRGRGQLTPLKDVEVHVDGDESPTALQAPNILIATGAHPQSLPGVEIDGESVLSSRHALALDECPRSMIVVGAGAIGVELAYFFNTFGTEVTLLEAESQVLPREDEEIAALLARHLENQGVCVRTGVQVRKVHARQKGGVAVALEAVGASEQVEELRADKLLMAVGVNGNTRGLGLEAVGVRLGKGGVIVDNQMQTTARNIYAAGDVIGAPQLAHAAAAEAVLAVESMAGREVEQLDHDGIPSCIYCQPQVASVGLTEARARQAGHEVKVGRFPFAASGKAVAAGETDGMVKLVFGSRYGDLLGGAVIGSEATELIAEIALARRLEATYEDLAHTVHAHPTLSEGIKEAAADAFGEALNT